ncbi:MAG: hypothetical protein RJA36_1651 [Pseudomonadota bacterium]|jgi:DNA (cytosine-5)-methyltransferase 1
MEAGLSFGSVCSGIEAASVAWHPLGWRAAWLAEIEPFPSAVLQHHYPQVPNVGDMATLPARIRAGAVPAPDLFCGGTPCQAFSVAGLRRSLDDARGKLSLTFCKIADAIDDVRRAAGQPACIVFWENVPGVLSAADNAFGCFLGALAGCDTAIEPLATTGWTDAGVVAGPARTIAWRILDAQFFGLAQRRRRVFAVGSARDGFDPAAVLLEWEGVRRDSAPSREAGESAAAGARSGVAFGGNRTSGPIDVAPALNACGTASGRQDFESEAFVMHSLRGEGFDASEDGTGRGTPLVPVHYAPDVHPTLVARSSRGGGQTNSPGHNADETLVAHAFDARQSDVIQYGDKTGPLDTNGHTVGVMQPVAFQPRIARNGRGNMGDVVNALQAQSGQTGKGDAAPCVATAMQVRRLTPVECERLQGFPDGYTAIPWRGRPASECPDGPRYKALGNSWAVPVVRWIGRRIDAAVRQA